MTGLFLCMGHFIIFGTSRESIASLSSKFQYVFQQTLKTREGGKGEFHFIF